MRRRGYSLALLLLLIAALAIVLALVRSAIADRWRLEPSWRIAAAVAGGLFGAGVGIAVGMRHASRAWGGILGGMTGCAAGAVAGFLAVSKLNLVVFPIGILAIGLLVYFVCRGGDASKRRPRHLDFLP